MNANEIKMLMENSKSIVTILQDLTISVGGISACLSAFKQINNIPDIKDLSKKELAKEISCIIGKEIAKYGTACTLVLTAPYLFKRLNKVLIGNKDITLAALNKVNTIKKLPFIVK